MEEIRIAFLGHKDHGKSTLIGRILHDTGSITKDRIEEAKANSKALGRDFEYAFLLDSFTEEREGGFTLDTTTAQARRADRIFNLIDVPGHKELVRNMLSGASLSDAGVLLLSAKEGEGLQDETRLHIFLAHLLGIRRMVVAINKMDSAGCRQEAFDNLKSGIVSVMVELGFDERDLSIIPISALNGDNVMHPSEAMPWYQGKCLMAMIEQINLSGSSSQRNPYRSRFMVQDVYDEGRMAVGKVECGEFRKGQIIKIHPGGDQTTIERIRGKDGYVEKAMEGSNIGIEPGRVISWSRGSICMDSDDPSVPRESFRARLFCLPDCMVSSGSELMLSCGPQESKARITKIRSLMDPIRDRRPRDGAGAETIGPSESADVDLQLPSPLLLDRFEENPPLGRFIISDEKRIIAIGVVL